MANPGTVGGTLFDTTLLCSSPDTFGGAGQFAPLLEEGNIYRSIPGVAGATKPASTGADIVVGFYALPAGSFDVAGRGLCITAEGVFAANTNTKRTKLWIGNTLPVMGSAYTGGTVITDGTAVTTSGGGWFISANVFKTGAPGSNTQTATCNGVINGSTHNGISAPLDLTLTENAIIYVAVTINCTTTATDAGLSFFAINAMN